MAGACSLPAPSSAESKNEWGCISSPSTRLQDLDRSSFTPTFLVIPYYVYINPLTPNDPYRGRTAPLTSKRCILYIYPTNIGTEYFKHGLYSPFFPLKNAGCFIILTYLFPVLFTFYIQGVLKFKNIIPAPKG